MGNHASTAVPHRTAAAGSNSLHRRVEQHARCVGLGRPSVGGRRTEAARNRFLQHRRGLSVLWRPAHRLLSSNERCAGMCSTVMSLSKQGFNAKDKQPPQLCSLTQRSWFSLALRGTAAPGCWGRAGTGFARAGGVGAFDYGATQRTIQMGLAVPSLPRSNPSIEGTSSSRLRLLPSAPHVKR